MRTGSFLERVAGPWTETVWFQGRVVGPGVWGSAAVEVLVGQGREHGSAAIY